MQANPPRWAERFLRWYCATDLYEEVAGDLEESFYQTYHEKGKAAANRHYGFLVLSFFNLSTIRGRQPKELALSVQTAMLRNYFLIAWRQMIREKAYAAINLLGLALGIATCILVALFVSYEYRFDDFHANKKDLYRLCEEQSWGGIIPQQVALSMYPMGPSLTQDYAEIEAFTRVNQWTQFKMEVGTDIHYADKVLWVDSSFLDLFTFELIHGNGPTALDQPGSVILTESLARRIFGRIDVMGELIEINPDPQTRIDLQVMGVCPDAPANSHLQFDMLLSLNSWPKEVDERRMTNWGGNWLTTYLKIRPGTDLAALEKNFPSFLEKYMGEDEEAEEGGPIHGYKLFLQPLTEVHLGSTDITHDYLNYRKFDGSYLNIFVMLGIFILGIATVNFTNLTTARSMKRSLEVGVRKTIGATRRTLGTQFVVESILYALIALGIAMVLVLIALPYFRELSGRPLSLLTLLRPDWLLGMLGSTLFIGWLAGLYPAQIMSRFDVVRSLKKSIWVRSQRVSVQDLLVVGQFAVAGIMIGGTLLTLRQLNYMMEFDPGFEREQVMLIPYNDRNLDQNFTQFREEVKVIPGVLDLTASGQRLGSNIHQTGVMYRGEDTAAVGFAASHLMIDHEFVQFYDIELLAGRNLDASRASDSTRAFIINESMLAYLGWELEEAIGQDMALSFNSENWGKVVGVVRDFHYNSLHHGINPLIMSVQDWWHQEISVRVDSRSLATLLPEIEQAWLDTGTERPFTYEFLDEHFAALYEDDRRLSEVVSIVATLAILVA
ncbi:MAG: ABC transporter permease, partial [Bacteroidota bacterium]